MLIPKTFSVILINYIVFSTALSPDVATVFSEMSTLSATIITANSYLSAYGGGITGAIPTINALYAVRSATKSATANIEAAEPLSAEDSARLLEEYGVLQPHIIDILNNAASKGSAFHYAGTKFLALALLQTFIPERRAFASAIMEKVTAENKPVIDGFVANIEGAFRTATTALS